MTDEQIEQQDEQPPEETPDVQSDAANESAVAADADGWHTELALESQRYVMKMTAPDGSIHICHSQDELDKLKAAYGK